MRDGLLDPRAVLLHESAADRAAAIRRCGRALADVGAVAEPYVEAMLERDTDVRPTGVFFEPQPLSPRQVEEFVAVAASWAGQPAEASATIRMPIERLRQLFGEWAQGA
ncbi:hypothetical protein ACWEPC_54300, partial [Nonomuraea sp. NPDC004297]